MILTFPGFDNDAKDKMRKSAGNVPPPPVLPSSPIIVTAKEKARKAAALTAARTSTILTSPSGVLGDPPLDRPMARSAQLLGGTG